MPEYLDDPSVLTKDKLKSELLAHNVELPSGNPTKDVYVQLYLKELTSQNVRPLPDTLDAFSSDEELLPPLLSGRNRSSSRVSPFMHTSSTFHSLVFPLVHTGTQSGRVSRSQSLTASNGTDFLPPIRARMVPDLAAPT